MEGASHSPFYLTIILFSPNKSLNILVGCVLLGFRFKYKWAQGLALEKIYQCLLFYSSLYILDFIPCQATYT